MTDKCTDATKQGFANQLNKISSQLLEITSVMGVYQDEGWNEELKHLFNAGLVAGNLADDLS